MDERTRQLVREALAKAEAGALKSVQSRLAALPEFEASTALRFIGEIRDCIGELLEGTLSPFEAEERLGSLIHGHPDPRVVRVLQDYGEAIHYLLTESRDGLLSAKRSKGH